MACWTKTRWELLMSKDQRHNHNYFRMDSNPNYNSNDFPRREYNWKLKVVVDKEMNFHNSRHLLHRLQTLLRK